MSKLLWPPECQRMCHLWQRSTECLALVPCLPMLLPGELPHYYLVHTNHSSFSKYHPSSVSGMSVSCGLCKNHETLLTSHWGRWESASTSLSGHPDAAVPAVLPLCHITQRICLGEPLFSESLNLHWILSPGPTQLSPGEAFQNLIFLAYISILSLL